MNCLRQTNILKRSIHLGLLSQESFLNIHSSLLTLLPTLPSFLFFHLHYIKSYFSLLNVDFFDVIVHKLQEFLPILQTKLTIQQSLVEFLVHALTESHSLLQ